VVEPPIVTIGQDLGFLPEISPDGRPYSAAAAIGWVLGSDCCAGMLQDHCENLRPGSVTVPG
jgi:hypothetical protein